ncbi:MarR family winged helix-turn-helix transcriptional regulator [Klenkia sp. PcliD-1-E]|uniref:MarR family winged helix-turn-helix transcriptional regulator n=1 Tax=Klenkia sp. PcliD-1-E TaxID=2954492 RepID=UPI002096BA65|nr:MarR family winged helix-turn-helix transcriptional regulator [Klenkia sp. PcliD-1-E]MCO7218366.1 MarR family winged helix-turn-helix transcriptional regulator [Klenkia sp. PcliD-1-E]
MQPLQDRPAPPLARLLLMGSRWFDAACAAELLRMGWPRLSPAQTLVFAYAGFDRLTVPTLARRLGNTRQSTHQLAQGLVDLGLFAFTVDPGRRGGRLLGITERGTALATDAYQVLGRLEATLGGHSAEVLREHLQLIDFERRPLPADPLVAAPTTSPDSGEDPGPTRPTPLAPR